ncbi:MAG: hypothetical protein ACLU38_01850 [Dysosmobacter sp.]
MAIVIAYKLKGPAGTDEGVWRRWRRRNWTLRKESRSRWRNCPGGRHRARGFAKKMQDNEGNLPPSAPKRLAGHCRPGIRGWATGCARLKVQADEIRVSEGPCGPESCEISAPPPHRAVPGRKP